MVPTRTHLSALGSSIAALLLLSGTGAGGCSSGPASSQATSGASAGGAAQSGASSSGASGSGATAASGGGNGGATGGAGVGAGGNASLGGAAAGEGGDSTAGPPSPIKYIVVLVKENHTFDSYFTGFPGAETSNTATLSTGQVVTRPAAPNGTLDRDLCHSHHCARVTYDTGKMDGIDKAFNSIRAPGAASDDDLALIHYTEPQIPNYWQYARHFVLADHFFQTTLADSFPGHFATTSGFNYALTNPSGNDGCKGTATVLAYDPTTCVQSTIPACWDYPSVVLNLPSGMTWAEYGNGTGTLMSNQRVVAQPDYASHFAKYSALGNVLGTATQPNLIFAHSAGLLSEHPPDDVCPGENDSVTLINKIMQSPQWPETALLLLWDDWGGFYDSVSPGAPKCATGDYMAPGFRLPLLIISAYAREGYVLKTPSEQASIVRLVEDLWGLPRMHDEDARIRDNTVGSLLDAFDFTQPPRAPLLLKTRTCGP